jgi:hypothetical protein
MKHSTKKLLEFAAGGGVLGALVVGGPAGIIGGAILGGVAKTIFARISRGGASFQGDPPNGVATIEEARFAKQELKRQLFSRPDVPWWLVGVGIGGVQPNYYVLVTVSDTSPEVQKWVPRSIQGVPVVADATGTQSLEMSTGL